ncbi:MAG: DUF2791 family P-loop domain-containing protein [Candidatus Marinimicrobia bacterium]|nr:DUF2791 family P-loop domain-containing protein [Candidatus Neomarinimicrobiota bacterium]
MNNILTLPKDQAYRIISALRKGTPPEEGVDLYSVGREQLLSYFEEKLIEIKNYGVSDVKFVSADWGHGKSHFLDLLRDLALKHNFVVSKVELHSREVPFDQLPIVIQRIMANIATPKERKNGLEALLNDWSVRNKSKSEQEIFNLLKDIGIYPDMRMKLVEYQRHYNCATGPEYQQCLQVLKWFEGKETKSKTFKDIREYLHNFVLFVRSLGYSGFVVMLDEAEAITSLSRINRRDLANENIRQIIDNDQDTQGFYFVFASTPTFLSGEDERGAQSYPALWRRISDPLQEFQTYSLHKVIVDLPKLTEAEFFKLAQKIKAVYEVAFGQNLTTVNENHLQSLAHYVWTRTDQRVGTMVRSTVAILDEATAPDFDFLARFEFIVEKAMEQEAVDRAR